MKNAILFKQKIRVNSTPIILNNLITILLFFEFQEIVFFIF